MDIPLVSNYNLGQRDYKRPQQENKSNIERGLEVAETSSKHQKLKLEAHKFCNRSWEHEQSDTGGNSNTWRGNEKHRGTSYKEKVTDRGLKTCQHQVT